MLKKSDVYHLSCFRLFHITNSMTLTYFFDTRTLFRFASKFMFSRYHKALSCPLNTLDIPHWTEALLSAVQFPFKMKSILNDRLLAFQLHLTLYGLLILIVKSVLSNNFGAKERMKKFCFCQPVIECQFQLPVCYTLKYGNFLLTTIWWNSPT